MEKLTKAMGYICMILGLAGLMFIYVCEMKDYITDRLKTIQWHRQIAKTEDEPNDGCDEFQKAYDD